MNILFDRKQFISTEKSADLSAIIQSALEAVNPERATQKSILLEGDFLRVNAREEIKVNGRLFVVGAGKASEGMMRGLINVLGHHKHIEEGVIITKKRTRGSFDFQNYRIKVLYGDHPVPGVNSIASTDKLIKMLDKCTEKDIVICLISGGASSLMTSPRQDLSLPDIQTTTSLLLACGAEIGEINAVRKHLDTIKGGGLIKLAKGAQIVSLIISDVVGDSLSVIGSGPTVPDPTTFLDAWMVLNKYGISEKVPFKVKEVLEKGMKGKLEETLKGDDPRFFRVQNVIVANNLLAAESAAAKARELDYEARVIDTTITGEARIVGPMLVSRLEEHASKYHKPGKRQLLIMGGETTVNLKGKGRGGRNLELALSAVRPLAGRHNLGMVTLATDGEDGVTDAAGAIVTGSTFTDGIRLGIWPETFLANNDSYTYFEKVGALIKTGSTGTNVMDLMLLFSF